MQSEPVEHLKVRSLSVIDDENATRATLAVNPDGGVTLFMSGKQAHMEIGINGNDVPHVTAHDAEGAHVITVAVLNSGGIGVTVTDRTQRVRIRISPGIGGEYNVTLD
jgi:hypothetical protein